MNRGMVFLSKEFQEYCGVEGIKHVMITIGVPRRNREVERMNKIIIAMLTKLTKNDSSS